jgi:hypothetical protein
MNDHGRTLERCELLRSASIKLGSLSCLLEPTGGKDSDLVREGLSLFLSMIADEIRTIANEMDDEVYEQKRLSVVPSKVKK